GGLRVARPARRRRGDGRELPGRQRDPPLRARLTARARLRSDRTVYDDPSGNERLEVSAVQREQSIDACTHGTRDDERVIGASPCDSAGRGSVDQPPVASPVQRYRALA